MYLSDTERITAFEGRFAKAQASEVVDLPFGFALLQSEFPLSHYHNRVVVTSPAPAAEVIAAADSILGGFGVSHRYVSFDDPLGGNELSAGLAAAGYEHETIATMVHAGTNPPPASHEVLEVSLDTVRPTIFQNWRDAIPDVTDEELRQLADRTALYERGAELVRLAVYDGDEIAAHADLYLDRQDHVAQFENLATRPDFRSHGYGGALLHDALRRGHDADAEIFFLSADLEDWPYAWYQRLGFVDTGRAHHFSRRQ